MSHDIRTPMNAIMGFTGLAAAHVDDPEQVKDYLQKITVSSQHLLALINDVLDMSRIESGRVSLEEANVHLPDVIRDLQTIVQANVTEKRQNLLIDMKDLRHEDVITDKLRLNQVLLNILSNAIKFTPAGGTISLSLAEEPSSHADTACCAFRIKDNGIGMSGEFQKTIFEAFTRERTSTVSGIQGTGLAMAITKNIVDLMGGTISVQSEEGKGSEFVVRIPFRIGESRAASEKAPEPQDLRAPVADGTGEAPAAADFTGKRIRAMEDQKKAGIPIIAVTANAFEEDRKIALAAGMNGHLAKPYDVNAIMQTLSELLI